MYLAVATRPDIAFAVGLACRYLERPMEKHVNAAKRILKYIKGTLNFGIRFGSNVPLDLFCFSDADYAGDIETRKSTSGFVFLFGTGRTLSSISGQNDVRYHFIREKHGKGLFQLRYVSTKDQVADIFTKPLPKHKFQYFRKLMGMC